VKGRPDLTIESTFGEELEPAQIREAAMQAQSAEYRRVWKRRMARHEQNEKQEPLHRRLLGVVSTPRKH